MRIAHLCLSCFYVDDCAYQENQLVTQHVRDGHEVIVIASTEVIDGKGNLSYVQPDSYLGSDGAKVYRLPYWRWLPKNLARKLRIYKGTRKLLCEFKPDVILFHGTCAMELMVVANYVRHNSAIRWYIDCHEDFNNSARNFLSKWILHRLIYRPILRYVLPLVQKVLCVTPESITFMRDFYKLKPQEVELFPLGGDVYDDEAYNNVREVERAERDIDENVCLFVQTGKLDAAKKLTSTLRAFRKIPGDRVRLLIAGKIMPDVVEEVEVLLAADSRVSYIGWINPNELKALLCAADVYVQPGSQSATMQMSLCCRCAVVLDDVPSHHIYYRGNGLLVKNESQLTTGLLNLGLASRADLTTMSNNSRDIAAHFLDYRKLARRVLS